MSQRVYNIFLLFFSQTKQSRDRISLHLDYFERSQQLATDMRQNHEYGVTLLSQNTPNSSLAPHSTAHAQPSLEDLDNDLEIGVKSTPKNQALNKAGRGAWTGGGRDLEASKSVSALNEAAVNTSVDSRNSFAKALHKTNSQPDTSRSIHHHHAKHHNPRDVTRKTSDEIINDVIEQYQAHTSRAVQNVNGSAAVTSLSSSSQSQSSKARFEALLKSNATAKQAEHMSGGHDSCDVKRTEVQVRTNVSSSKVLAMLAQSHGRVDQVLHFAATKIQVCLFQTYYPQVLRCPLPPSPLTPPPLLSTSFILSGPTNIVRRGRSVTYFLEGKRFYTF